MTRRNFTRWATIPTVALGSLGLATVADAANAVPPTDPPIAEIGAQYATETGATNVACAAFGGDFICYGLLDGKLVAGTWVDGVFTPYAEAVTETIVTTTTDPDRDDDGARNFIDLLVAGLDLDLLTICPIVNASPELVQDSMADAFDAFKTNPDVVAAAERYGVPIDEFVEMIQASIGNRLITEC